MYIVDPRWFALAAYTMYWSAVVFALMRRPRVVSKPLSDHIAASSFLIRLFLITVGIETVLYSIFFYRWLIPVYDIQDLFKIVISLALLTHFLTFVFPSTEGLIKTVHWWVSYLTAALFIPIAVLLIMQSGIPIMGRVVVAVSLIAMITIMAGLKFSSVFRRYTLIFHNAYIISLQSAIVLISILGK